MAFLLTGSSVASCSAWLAMITVLVGASACADRAEPSYKQCSDLESRGELKAALAACTEAVATDSGSKSGKAAAEKARTLKARIDAEERAEVERRRKAAEEEKRGIETECHGLLASFVSAEEQARSRFMYKNVRTGGQVTRSPADGKLTFCSHGSDAEGVAADILCILGRPHPKSSRAWAAERSALGRSGNRAEPDGFVVGAVNTGGARPI